MIEFVLRRTSNLHWQSLEVDKVARARLNLHKRLLLVYRVIRARKSAIANLLEKRLYAEGRHTYLLDGDNVRLGINRDLGFTEADRVETIRRVAEIAKLMVDAGLIVDTPIAVCQERDPKGLHAKVRQVISKISLASTVRMIRRDAPEFRWILLLRHLKIAYVRFWQC